MFAYDFWSSYCFDYIVLTLLGALISHLLLIEDKNGKRFAFITASLVTAIGIMMIYYRHDDFITSDLWLFGWLTLLIWISSYFVVKIRIMRATQTVHQLTHGYEWFMTMVVFIVYGFVIFLFMFGVIIFVSFGLDFIVRLFKIILV